MRLIDADALMREFAEFVRASNNSDFSDVPTWNDAVSLLDSAPTIEPKRGRWIEERSGKVLDLVKYHCSECGRWQTWSNFPYCPNCGAEMEAAE